MSVAMLTLSAHLLSDFPFQPTWMAKGKTESMVTMGFHILIHITAMYILIGFIAGISMTEVHMIVWATACIHAVIDSRRWVEAKPHFESYPWVVDQIMHITSIAIVVSLVL